MTTGIPMTTKATNEAVEAAAKAWGSSKANSFSGIMRAALEAAYPHITPHGIGVKGLEWGKYTDKIAASSVAGFYHIRHDGDEPEAWSWSLDAGLKGLVASEQEAKAACQADCETRILSALQRNPEGDVVRDEELTLAKDAVADFVLHSLVEALKLDRWTPQEGSETWEGDVHATLMHILRASVLDPETDEPLYLHSPRGQGTATHRHKKRGSEYVLLGIGKMQAERWYAKEIGPVTRVNIDMREVAVYRSVDDGSLWVRPREEFEDGRFEPLSPKATKGDGV